jgi:recombination protein RecA
MSAKPFLQGLPSSLPKGVVQGLDARGTQSIQSFRLTLPQLFGRLVEISGHRAAATLTVAFDLVREAQALGEAVCWVTLRQSTFFPPDVAESGVDLARLAVVRVCDLEAAARATVELTRSGGFGLVVLDMGPETILETLDVARARLRDTQSRSSARRRRRKARLATPLITKLVGLAQKEATAVVVLTDKTPSSSSLSSLVSLRVEARRNPDALPEVTLEVLKDKRRGPGRSYQEVYRGPAGLR